MPTKELEQQAVHCFRNVTGFMGDRDSKKEETGHAEKLIRTCLHAPEELRDEVFCQIIKQTTNNPSPESALKGWMLLGICAGAIAPSRDFEKYLLSYCETHANESQSIGDYAKFTIGRIIKTAALTPRRETPLPMEVEAAKMRLPVLLRVFHLDGSFDMMPINSWVTPAVLKAMICEKRGIKNGDAFGIYEMTPQGEERFLEPEERLLDLVAYWQRLFEEERSKTDDASSKKQRKKALGNTSFYRVVFKVHMYFDVVRTIPESRPTRRPRARSARIPCMQGSSRTPSPASPALPNRRVVAPRLSSPPAQPADDAAAQHEMYVQASYDVVSARYPCGERDCLALAALQLQAENGDAGLVDLNQKLERYLPAKYAESTRTSELANEIRKQHAEHAGKSQKAVEHEYMDYVKEWQVYGSSFFFVEPQMNSEMPEEIFMAVNPKGILLINPDTKEVLSTYPYSEVPTWGHSQSSFVLHIGNLIRQTKLYFATEQGKEINDLVRAYVNHLVVSA